MGRLRLLGAAIALALGVLTFGLVPAAAENPGKPSSPPGQEKTPPGQAAKAEKTDEKEKSEKATPPGQLDQETTEPGEPAPSVAQTAQADDREAAPDAKAPSSHPKPKQAADPKPKAVEQEHVHESAKPAKPAQDESARGNSAVAHVHVIICHRTGSTKNPYVVINISKSAWLEGHTTHPALNGHNDILLKEGAAPGEKMPRSACGQSAQPNTPKPPSVDVTPKQPETPKETPKPTGKPADPVTSTPAGTPTVTPTVVPTVPTARPASKPSVADADVAGEVEVFADELPFTGVPVWLAVFAGCLLLGTGLAIRKASWAPEGDAQPVSTSAKKADTVSR